jgi:hypothetical protein
LSAAPDRRFDAEFEKGEERELLDHPGGSADQPGGGLKAELSVSIARSNKVAFLQPGVPGSREIYRRDKLQNLHSRILLTRIFLEAA